MPQEGLGMQFCSSMQDYVSNSQDCTDEYIKETQQYSASLSTFLRLSLIVSMDEGGNSFSNNLALTLARLYVKQTLTHLFFKHYSKDIEM